MQRSKDEKLATKEQEKSIAGKENIALCEQMEGVCLQQRVQSREVQGKFRKEGRVWGARTAVLMELPEGSK